MGGVELHRALGSLICVLGVLVLQCSVTIMLVCLQLQTLKGIMVGAFLV